MEVTSTEGSGAYDLDGAVVGYQSFADVGNGNTCYYTASDGRSWETGLGTYILASSRLIRTTILDGSNGTSPVNWIAGQKNIWVDYPASQIAAAGTVTAVSVATANGLAGSSSGGATPQLTLSTTVNGLVQGNGTALSALLGTSGYALIGNGVSTPTFQGFVQTGTSAVTRTWNAKASEQLSVKDFGATGDGVTNDTAAILAAETARAAIGGELIFPPGTYLTNGTIINRANGGVWRGVGEAILLASANSTVICNLTGAVIGANAKAFRITGLTFDGNGKTSVRAVNENGPYLTQFDQCVIKQVQFAGAFIGANVVSQHGWIQIHDIIQYGAGSWAFYGFDNTKYLFHIEINNIHQIGTGGATWESTFWFEGRRAVGLSMNNVWSGSLDGGADGLLLRGDCQGVFVTNSTFVWGICGIRALTWTDSLKPSYVYLTNIGVDQHTESGADIEGRTWFITNANFANGYVRTNTGSAAIIEATSTDIAISNSLFAYDQKSGLVIKAGATKVRVNGITAENNNQAAGAFYDVDLQASTFKDVVLYGKNYIAGATNATGQRLVGGVTSSEVNQNTGSASTTAVTTQEDLMTYSIAANTLKPGQRVRLVAWGTTAANANTKTVRLWFGANSVIDHSGAWNAIPWRLEAEVVIIAASSQKYSSVGWPQANVQSVRQGTAANDETLAITVKCTGQNGTANAGDITCNGFTVDILS